MYSDAEHALLIHPPLTLQTLLYVHFSTAERSLQVKGRSEDSQVSLRSKEELLTLRAFSVLPLRSRLLGLSGAIMAPARNISAGTIAKPRLKRQPHTKSCMAARGAPLFRLQRVQQAWEVHVSLVAYMLAGAACFAPNAVAGQARRVAHIS